MQPRSRHVVVLALFALAACMVGLVPARAGMVEVNALADHAKQIKARLATVAAPEAGKNKVAVLTLKGDDANEAVRTKVEECMVAAGKFELVDRANLQRLITEVEFQEGEEIDPDTAQKLSIKGVDYLVLGHVTVQGGADSKQPYVLGVTLKMVNCSTAVTPFLYSEVVQTTVSEQWRQVLMGLGPQAVLVIGFVLIVLLVVLFRVFGTTKGVIVGTIGASVWATVKDYLLSDKKIRDATAAEVRQAKDRIREAAGSADGAGKKDVATALNKLAGDVDMLAQTVVGAPFGQDIAQARAIPRDVAERLRAADLAFTDRVADFVRNAARLKQLASEGRFDGLEQDVRSLTAEASALRDKFEERGRILRSF